MRDFREKLKTKDGVIASLREQRAKLVKAQVDAHKSIGVLENFEPVGETECERMLSLLEL